MTTPDQPTTRYKDLPTGQMDAVETAMKAVSTYGEACLDHGMSEEGEDTSSQWAAAREALVQLLARGVAEGRRQATEGWELHSEEEQWSVWWTSPGGGLNVSVPLDADDPEEAARELHAQYGGELKHRTLRTLESPWEAAERESAGFERLPEVPESSYAPGAVALPLEPTEPCPRIAHESGVVLACRLDHQGEPAHLANRHANPAHRATWDGDDDRIVVEPAEQGKPTCTCPMIDVTIGGHAPSFVKGYDPACPVCPNPYAPAAKLRSLRAHPHGSACICDDCTARDEAEAAQRAERYAAIDTERYQREILGMWPAEQDGDGRG